MTDVVGPLASAVSRGHRLFAQYAHVPNALGYCGPEDSAGLQAVARGAGAGVDVPALARRFSGAWPYQQVLAELSGIADPLDEQVVRAYWTGNELTDRLDGRTFGAALLDRIRSQAGPYWTHLTDDLLAEAAPTHAFHVLGVYPWSRLLDTGRPEPLHVLESCRIGWARVLAVGPDTLTVALRRLRYDGTLLTLGGEREEQIGRRPEGGPLVQGVVPGNHVAVHWGHACDVLDDAQVGRLEHWTERQLATMAPRVRGV